MRSDLTNIKNTSLNSINNSTSIKDVLTLLNGNDDTVKSCIDGLCNIIDVQDQTIQLLYNRVVALNDRLRTLETLIGSKNLENINDKITVLETRLNEGTLSDNREFVDVEELQYVIDELNKNVVHISDEENILGAKTFSAGLNLNGTRIRKVKSPVDGTDAATKNYVDNNFVKSSDIEGIVERIIENK